MLPIGIAILVRQPAQGQERFGLQTVKPHLPPVITDKVGIGRARGIGPHGGSPAKILVQQASALVVDIIGITIDSRTQGDDGLQRRRVQRCNLQAVEPAPADPHHANGTAAPWL